jgi:hypothetical protein
MGESENIWGQYEDDAFEYWLDKALAELGDAIRREEDMAELVMSEIREKNLRPC